MYLPVTLFYILCYGLYLCNSLFSGLCIIFLLRKILFIVTRLGDIHLFKAKDSLRFLRNNSKKEYNVTLTFHLSSFEHDINDLKIPLSACKIYKAEVEASLVQKSP